SNQIATSAELKSLGPEPLGEDFSADYLFAKSRGRKTAIKNFLMDQRIVAGIGNIYASEILFRAAVRPTRRALLVTRAEYEKIVSYTKKVLGEAIDSRGTTFRSYLDSSGEPGSFGARLKAYGRDGKRCYRCGGTIQMAVVGQRSTYFCPKCQR